MEKPNDKIKGYRTGNFKGKGNYLEIWNQITNFETL